MASQQAGHRPTYPQQPPSAPPPAAEPSHPQQPATHQYDSTPNLYVSTVTMGDQPYRTLGQRASSPSESLTVEQVADLRLCTSALSPDECRRVLIKLEDTQVKNAVYDRVLCFPSDGFTRAIQEDFAKKVKATNKNVISFVNYFNHIKTYLGDRKTLSVFGDEDFKKLDADFKAYISPSVDSIGVYSTHSEYSMTKRNGLTSLIDIGNFFLELPILQTPQGQQLFVYDYLSRAVGNILNSAANPLQREQMLEYGVEEALWTLERRGREAGLFTCLAKALSAEPISSQYSPYWLPELKLPPTQPKKPAAKRNSRAPKSQPAAKRLKEDTASQQGIVASQQNVVQSQKGVVYQQQQGPIDPQLYTGSPQQGTCAPQQATASPNQASVQVQQPGSIQAQQQGLVDPQLYTNATTQQGTDGPQEGSTIQDMSNISFDNSIDPRESESWWSNQSSSETPRGVNEGCPAASDGSRNPFAAPPASAGGWTYVPSLDGTRNVVISRVGSPSSIGGHTYVPSLDGTQQVPMSRVGTPSSIGGQTYVPSLDETQQQMARAGSRTPNSTGGQAYVPTLDGNQQQATPSIHTEQLTGRSHATQQPQNPGQEQIRLAQLEAATQQHQAPQQVMPTQQLAAVQDSTAAQHIPQIQNMAQPSQQFQQFQQFQPPGQDPSARQGVAGQQPAQHNRPLAPKPAVQYAGTHPMYYQKSNPQTASQQAGSSQPAQQAQGSEQTTTTQPTKQAAKPRKPRAKRPTKKQQAEEAAAQVAAVPAPPAAGTSRTDTPESQWNHTPASFQDIIADAYQEVYVTHAGKEAHLQKIIAGVVARRVEGGCQVIRNRLARVGEVHRDIEVFLKSQEAAVWAFLWHLESCALDRAATPLSAELTRQLIGDQIVKYFWGCVMNTEPANMKRLLYSVDSNGVTFEVKLDAIIHCINNDGITGWGKLQYLLDEMRVTATKA